MFAESQDNPAGTIDQDRGLHVGGGMAARGLFADPTNRTDGYIDRLPTFQGYNLVEIVDARVSQGEKPRILDIGYGSGRMLLAARARWGSAVELVGFGNELYTKISVRDGEGNVLPITEPLLQAAQVQLVRGDIREISAILDENYADVITVLAVLGYIHHPHWELVKDIYRVLKLNGVALISPINLLPAHSDTPDLANYLNNLGYKTESERYADEMSFQKNKINLDAPVICRGRRGHYTYEF